MFGTDRDGGVGPRPGTACINLVVPTDADVDQTLARALAAGAGRSHPSTSRRTVDAPWR